MTASRALLRFLSPYDRIRLFQSVSFFESLEADDLAALAEHAEEEHRRRGAYLIQRDQPVDAVRVLVEGEALMRRHGSPVRRIGPGCPIGFITGAAEEDGTEVIASTRTLSLMLKTSVWFDLLEDRFPILHHLLRAIARQLREESAIAGFIPEAHLTANEVPRSAELEDIFDRFLVLRGALSSFTRPDLYGLWHLSRRSTVMRFSAGDLLYGEHGDASDLLLLTAGHVRCKREESDLDLSFGPGQVLGLIDTLAEEGRSHTATAATAGEGVRIDREELFDMFEDHFDIARGCLAATARLVLDAIELRAANESQLPSGFTKLS